MVPQEEVAHTSSPPSFFIDTSRVAVIASSSLELVLFFPDSPVGMVHNRGDVAFVYSYPEDSPKFNGKRVQASLELGPVLPRTYQKMSSSPLLEPEIPVPVLKHPLEGLWLNTINDRRILGINQNLVQEERLLPAQKDKHIPPPTRTRCAIGLYTKIPWSVETTSRQTHHGTMNAIINAHIRNL